jgi:hypothetical protein
MTPHNRCLLYKQICNEYAAMEKRILTSDMTIDPDRIIPLDDILAFRLRAESAFPYLGLGEQQQVRQKIVELDLYVKVVYGSPRSQPQLTSFPSSSPSNESRC